MGERSYGIFEAVHLGLQLPMVIPMMPVVSLNTFGTRRLKTSSELAGAYDNAPVSWDSKVDKFDKRLSLVRQQFMKSERSVRERWEMEVRDVSLYEFYWKYAVSRGRVYISKTSPAIMVTPAISSNAAQVDHPRHAFYARTCVVAFWRMMSTSRRYALMEHVADLHKDHRRWGGSWFEDPVMHAGESPSLLDRHLGVFDLMCFDSPKRQEVRWSQNDAGGFRCTVFRRARGS